MSDPDELPPIAKEPLSVLLLASNNAAALPEVPEDWAALLNGLERDYEILIVDDGSTDGTGALAASLAERQPRVRVLTHPTPMGRGAALRTGLAGARFPLLLQTTCDRQYQPEDLKRFLEHIDKVHLVSGYRVSRPMPLGLRLLGLACRAFVRVVFGESQETLPGWLGWSGHGRRWLARIFFGVRVQDVDCEFRLFRRSIFARLPIQSDGDFAQVEVLAKANFLGHLMTEEPVRHRPEPGAGRRRSARQTWREAYRVLSHADFGPAQLPEPAPPSAEEAPKPLTEPVPTAEPTTAPGPGTGDPARGAETPQA
jgi:glycosyltransferase involved in cell wall biosynthesis